MVISYMGGECFKITQGDLTIAINPPSKDSTLKNVKFGSDITLVSQNHSDFNGTENTAFGEREPFIINGPGEYEVRGVAVRGFASESWYGKKRPSDRTDSSIQASLNTIYSISLEGMNLCFLGALGNAALPAAAKQELDDIDILFLPIGSSSDSDQAAGIIGYAEAYKLAVQLEPKAVIPMHYSPETLKAFLKEAAVDKAEPQDKLTIKKKDLDGKENEIIILNV